MLQQLKQNKILPKAKHVTGDLCCGVGEKVVTNRSPRTVTKNCQTPFAVTRASRQPHCKTVASLMSTFIRQYGRQATQKR